MSKNDIGISAESVVDLPRNLIETYDINIIHFYVTTETGTFRDVDEISSNNVVEYYRKGGSALVTSEASVEEYMDFFRMCLERCGELIHICISSSASDAFSRACEAREKLGLVSDRIKIVDSESLSTGIGHLAIIAASMRDEGKRSDEIIDALTEKREHLSVSFISKSPEQMFRNGRMSKAAKRICTFLRVHPVFALKKGKIVLNGLGFGNMERATKRYVRKVLRNRSAIETDRLFITHAGCSLGQIAEIKKEVAKILTFDDIIVTEASATVSGNSGEGTVGLLYMRKN